MKVEELKDLVRASISSEEYDDIHFYKYVNRNEGAKKLNIFRKGDSLYIYLNTDKRRKYYDSFIYCR